jgi:hypothetical protein
LKGEIRTGGAQLKVRSRKGEEDQLGKERPQDEDEEQWEAGWLLHRGFRNIIPPAVKEVKQDERKEINPQQYVTEGPYGKFNLKMAPETPYFDSHAAPANSCMSTIIAFTIGQTNLNSCLVH